MQTTKQTIIVTAICVAILVGFNFVGAAGSWNDPACSPPGCNAETPINVSGEAQYKDGTFESKLLVSGTTPNPTWGNLIVGSANTNTVYAYGSMCVGNASGYCDSTGGVVIQSNGVKFPDGTLQTTAATGSGGGSGSSLWQSSGTTLYYNGGQVGIGTSNPGVALGVIGGIHSAGGSDIGVKAWGGLQGVYAEAGADNGIGVLGRSQAKLSGGRGVGVQGDGSWYDFYAVNGRYNWSSSIRWKENIKPITDALKKVMQLSGVYYDWTKDGSGERQIGMIAEDVGKVLPEIVGMDPDNPEYAVGMDYARLSAVLVEAIKEQQRQIEELKAEIKSLKK